MMMEFQKMNKFIAKTLKDKSVLITCKNLFWKAEIKYD